MFLSGVARDVLHVDVDLALSLAHAGPRHRARRRLARSLPDRCSRDLREFPPRRQGARGRRSRRRSARRLGALQQTFKILINSFYGYLAFSQGHWNDYDAANRVTGEGRRPRPALVAGSRTWEPTVIEVDTDGLYFTPPPSPAGRDAEDAPHRRAGAAFSPPASSSSSTAATRRCLSYKMKNYVLLDERGTLLIKGSGLRSRGHRAVPARVDGGDVPAPR